MKCRNIIIILFLILLSCCKEKVNERLDNINNICKNDIIQLTILTEYGNQACLIEVNNRVIIDEFKKLLVENTYDSDEGASRFNRNSIITIKTINNKPFTLIVMNKYYLYPKIKDQTRIMTFENPYFDVARFYNIGKYDPKSDILNYLCSKFECQMDCVQLQNNSLISFINKYIEDKNINRNNSGIKMKCRSNNSTIFIYDPLF